MCLYIIFLYFFRVISKVDQINWQINYLFNLIVIISWFKNFTMVVFFKYELFWRHSVWRKFKMVCNTHLYQQQQPTNCENGDDAQLIFTWEWSSEVFSREEKEKNLLDGLQSYLIGTVNFHLRISEKSFSRKFSWNWFHGIFFRTRLSKGWKQSGANMPQCRPQLHTLVL